MLVAEQWTYEALLAALPAGALQGSDLPEFGVVERPAIFVPPRFTQIEADEAPGVSLISARGATGKSILGEALAADKGVPLWRLDRDKGVSGDALESRLGRYLGPSDPFGVFASHAGGFIVVDALDEARMRVSGTSWTEFLESLFTLANTGHRLVMLGRERVLEDVWLEMSDAGIGVRWLEISHFDHQQRADYVDALVRKSRDLGTPAYVSARDAILTALAGTVDVDLSDAFVGYAPVLDAVVALLAKGNLMAVENAFTNEGARGDQIAVLTNVLRRLLAREQLKTAPLADELDLDSDDLYSPDEQIDWLLHELAGLDQPSLTWCPDSKRGEYVGHVSEFLRDHPFRSEDRWASPVFSAFVGARRFDRQGLRAELLQTGAETGLLFEFVSSAADSVRLIDEWQFAALHSSLLAAEWREAEAVVDVRADTVDQQSAAIDQAEAQLVLLEGGRAERAVNVELLLEKADELVVRGPASAISVVFPASVVVEPRGSSLTLGPDCYVRCRDLRLRSETVEISRRSESGSSGESAAVVLDVEHSLTSDGTLTGSPPTASLEIRVPNELTLAFPWVNYRGALEPIAAPPNDRAVRFLNMLMNLARTHGHKDGMAVFDKKLQGRQSVKGEEFVAVLNLLESEGIIQRRGAMIYLTQYAEERRFSGKTIEGLATLEDAMEEWRPVLDKIAGVLKH